MGRRNLAGSAYQLFANWTTSGGSKSFARDVLILVAGTAGAQAVALAVAPVLTRMYSPSDFGLLGLFVAVATIVATVATLRYEVPIILPKDDEEARSLAVLAAGCAIVVGSLISIAVVLIPDSTLSTLSPRLVGWWTPLAVVAGGLTALMAITNALLNRTARYQWMAAVRVTQAIVTALAAVLLGVMGRPGGLLLAQFVAGLVATSTLVLITRQAFRSVAFRRLLAVARHHAACPRYLLPASGIEAVASALPIFLISAWFGVDDAGYFSLAWRVLLLPLALFGQAFGQVFSRRFAIALSDPMSARSLLIRCWVSLFIVGIIPATMLLLLGPALFGIVFGAAWEPAGQMASLMAPMMLASFVSSPTSTTYVALGLQRTNLWFGLGLALTRPGAMYLGWLTSNIFFGLLLWSIVEVLLILLFNLIALRELRNPSRSKICIEDGLSPS